MLCFFFHYFILCCTRTYASRDIWFSALANWRPWLSHCEFWFNSGCNLSCSKQNYSELYEQIDWLKVAANCGQKHGGTDFYFSTPDLPTLWHWALKISKRLLDGCPLQTMLKVFTSNLKKNLIKCGIGQKNTLGNEAVKGLIIPSTSSFCENVDVNCWGVSALTTTLNELKNNGH